MRLAIAQFTYDLKLAGQQRILVDLAKAFMKKGHRSLVCTTQQGGELVEELEMTDIPFQCLGLKKSWHPRALIPVMRYIRNNNVDVVITHGNSGCLIPRVAAVLARVPCFIHVEHTISEGKSHYHLLINKFLSFFTDRIVCVSESARQSLLKNEGTRDNKAITIYNGVDSDRLVQNACEQGKPGNVQRVGIVANFSEVKGHACFVEAAVRIVSSFKDVEFVFVGDGPLQPQIEQKVMDYGLGRYCRFLGVRSDVGALMQTFDVFVLSSLWEGLPVSLLEAQYFGIASVATNVGGIPEVIEDGYNGLLVPPENPNALASAVLSILRDEKLKTGLSQHGKEMYARNYTVEKMATKYLDLICDILHDKGMAEQSGLSSSVMKQHAGK